MPSHKYIIRQNEFFIQTQKHSDGIELEWRSQTNDWISCADRFDWIHPHGSFNTMVNHGILDASVNILEMLWIKAELDANLVLSQVLYLVARAKDKLLLKATLTTPQKRVLPMVISWQINMLWKPSTKSLSISLIAAPNLALTIVGNNRHIVVQTLQYLFPEIK